jgi:rubrerythrin
MPTQRHFDTYEHKPYEACDTCGSLYAKDDVPDLCDICGHPLL